MKSLRLYHFACILVCACSIPAAHADDASKSYVLRNARVWTGDVDHPWVDAVAIAGSRITAVGAATSPEFDHIEQDVDLGGVFVMPGIIDAHAHVLSAAQRIYEVDLLDAGSVDELLRRVRKFAEAHPDDEWIRGRGWEYSDFPDAALPTRQMLDEVIADRPVQLSAFDGHTSWVNTKALELAEITAESRLTRPGEVVLDPQSGEPTGVLKESAQSLLDDVLPRLDRSEQLAALRQFLPELAQRGITCVHNASGDAAELALFRQLLADDALTVRMRFYPHVMPGSFADDIPATARLAADFAHPLLRVVGVKLWLDGVIETHTAALLEPYADQPSTRGAPAYTAEQLASLTQAAQDAGLQVMIHAIGDRAVRMALDAAAAVQSPVAQSPVAQSPAERRLRIEHIETVAADDLPRFAELGVIASMQPIHAHPTSLAPWERALGPDRAGRGFAWKLLADAGARLAFGSDWPAGASFDPWRAIHLAVTRQDTAGQPPGGWHAEHALPLEAALRAFTAGGAFAAFDESRLGVLAPGRLADLIVLDRDPFQIPASELHQVRARATIVAGRVVWQDDNFDVSLP